MRSSAALAFLLALVLAACGSSTEPEPIWGIYNLQTVAGQPLPYVIYQEGADKFEITAGHWRLNSDMTCHQDLTFRVTEDGVVTIETDTGYWTLFTVSGSSLTFTSSGPGGFTLTGSLVGKTLTLIEEGVVFVYVKP